jgi:hypothetical protein
MRKKSQWFIYSMEYGLCAQRLNESACYVLIDSFTGVPFNKFIDNEQSLSHILISKIHHYNLWIDLCLYCF